MILHTTEAIPFWWLETSFGKMVFVMIIITWGLVLIDLFLVALALVRYICGKKRITKKNNFTNHLAKK